MVMYELNHLKVLTNSYIQINKIKTFWQSRASIVYRGVLDNDTQCINDSQPSQFLELESATV